MLRALAALAVGVALGAGGLWVVDREPTRDETRVVFEDGSYRITGCLPGRLCEAD